MAGEAKSNAFMLGSATVMLGAPEDLFDLNPDDHSIGLVKNFRVTGEPSYTDLTQGVKNSIVYSVMTGNTIRAAMEAYEYTSKNIAYSMGLEGSTLAPITTSTETTKAETAAATSVTVTAATGITAGDTIMIQDGEADNVWLRVVTSVATNVVSFDEPLPKPIAIGAKVQKMNVVEIGSKDEQPFLAAKVVGTLADGSEIAMLFPKVRITNGFSLGFVTENFDNMPYEFTFYDVVNTDPHYASFKGSQGKLFTAG